MATTFSKIVAELIGTTGEISADKLAPGAGGTDWTTAVQTSDFTAENNKGYYLNTSGGAIRVTLPASPTAGSVVSIVDAAGSADSNRITLNPNGENINGDVYELDIDVERGGAQLTYSSTYGWVATEAVNSLEGTNRTGKILVESHPVVTSLVNTTDSLAYFQADNDQVKLTGRNLRPGSVISFVKASGGSPIDYTTNVNGSEFNAARTEITFNIPAGLDDDAANDPFDVYVTLPTSSDNPTIPLVSTTVEDIIEWLPTPAFSVASGSLGFIYSDDSDLSSLTVSSVPATSTDSGDTITYADDGNLPAGLSINATSGAVEGTLSASFGNSGSTVNTFVVTATATGETGLTKSETRTYSIELRSTRVNDAWIGTDGTTDYDGGSGTTITVKGFGFNGTDTLSAVNFITGGSSYAGTNVTVVDDNTITVDTPQAFTVAQTNIDVEVVLTSGYTYKLSQSAGTTLLTTGSAPTMGTPGTITITSADRGTSWTAQIPVATDDGSIVSYSATFTPSDGTTDVSGFSIDNSGLISATLASDFFAAGGTITAAVTATDNAGNTSSENYTITVDVIQQSIYTTEIATSAMFDGSSDLRNRCVSSVSNFFVWCFSVWVKLSDLSATNTILWSGTSYTDSSSDDGIDFYLNSLRVYSNSGSGIGSSTQKYRDTSAWYHVYGEYNSNNVSGKILLYVNNEYVGEFANANQFDWNFDNGYRKIGAQGGSPTLKGYLADYYFIDGQALSPSAFGQYSTQGTNVYWIPKDYGHDGSGDTAHWGNNGFHLKFDDPTFATYGLGKDSSGRGNHWTPSA
jgi:hypothetical protein